MSHRISSSIMVRLLAAQMVLFGAAASPAAAKFHHHHTGGPHHGAQAGISGTGSGATADPATKATEPDWKGDGKGSSGEQTPSSHQANTKGENAPNGAAQGDDHSGKSADHSGKSDDHGATDNQNGTSIGPKDNPIDTSNTITGPPKFVHRANTQGWKGFKIAPRLGKSSGAPKIWTPKRTIFTRSKTFTKARIIRNAIGQPLNQVVKKDEPPAVNRIHRPVPLATGGPGGSGAVASDPHHKPLVPLAWSVGRPHDPPASATPYRTSLDGRGMIRLGAGTAAVGGGVNLNSGVLSGLSFHPKPR